MKRHSSAYMYAKQTGLTDKSLLAVISIISLAQGLIGATDNLFSYIFKDDYKFPLEESSFISSLSTFPWTIKLLWGIISDSYPICGYKRKSYLVLTSLLGWFALVNFGIGDLPPLYLGICYYLLNSVSQSFQSVIAEAVMVESVQKENSIQDSSEEKKSATAAHRLSFYYSASLIGGVIYTVFTIFFLNNHNRPKFMFCTSFIPLGVLMSVFLLHERSIKQKAELLLKKGSLLVDEKMYLLDPAATDMTRIEEENDNTTTQDKVSISSIKQAFTFLKNPIIFMTWIYIFLSNFGANAGQADFYYQTEILKFNPSFMGVITLITNISAVIGILVYTKFYAMTSLRKFYTLTTILQTIFALANIPLYLGITDEFGIPAKVFVSLNAIPTGFFAQICVAPINVLACRLCPKGLEATTYAILMSTLSLSTGLSTQLGAVIQKWLGIAEQNYKNYWQFSIVSQVMAVIVLLVMWRIRYEHATNYVDDINFQALEKEEVDVRRATIEIKRKSTSKKLLF